MERLTKTYNNGTHGAADKLPCGENSYKYKELLLEALGKYEDLEEQGLLLHLPFSLETEYIYVVEKYGMKIYKLDAGKIAISKMPISNDILYEIDGFELTFQDFGEIAFLTQKEAEAKLEEMEESHD